MSNRRIQVAALASTPIKGLRVAARSRIMLERGGVRCDRRFYLVDEDARMVNGKQLGALNTVTADLDEREQRLTLTFPGGETIAGAIELGETLQSSFFSRSRPARMLLGPFSSALSEHVGRSLRLVAPADGSAAVDRGEQGAVSLISRASLSSLARVAGKDEIDARRFRMSIEVAGTDPHEEDGWIERELTIGAARIVLHGHVGRCIVTSRHPDSGEVDLATLDHLRAYRSSASTTEPLAFGVYGSVERPGIVHIGDAVKIVQRTPTSW
jgi:uncharacterized protein YcbX